MGRWREGQTRLFNRDMGGGGEEEGGSRPTGFCFVFYVVGFCFVFPRRSSTL